MADKGKYPMLGFLSSKSLDINLPNFQPIKRCIKRSIKCVKPAKEKIPAM